MSQEDSQLVSAARSGDEAAWVELLQRHRGCILSAVRAAVRKGGDRDEALSLAHEGLMRAVRYWDEDRGVTFLNYLWRVVRATVWRGAFCGLIHIPRHARKGAEKRVRKVRKLETDVLSHDADEFNEEDVQSLHRAMERLSNIEWAVVRDRLSGDTLEVISKRQRFSIEGVRKIEKRAIWKLREYFGT